MSRIDDILDLQKKKGKKKDKKFKKYRDEETTGSESTTESAKKSTTDEASSKNRTVISLDAEDDDDLDEEDLDDDAVDTEDDSDSDDGQEEDAPESSNSDNRQNDKKVSPPSADSVFDFDDPNSEDIDDSEASLMDIFVNRMFKQDPILVHKAVAHTMATDLKPVALFLFNWYASQGSSPALSNYETAKNRVVNVLRMRYGKFNDEAEFTHAVAHWFVNGVLGIRK